MWTLTCGYLITTICITSSFSIKSIADTNDDQLNSGQFMYNPIKLLIPSNVVDYDLLDPYSYGYNLNNQLTNYGNNDFYSKGKGNILRDYNHNIGQMEGGEGTDGQSPAYQLINHIDYGLINKEDDSGSYGYFEPEGGGKNNNQLKVSTTTAIKPESSSSPINYNQHDQLLSSSSTSKKRSSVMLNRLGFALHKAAHKDPPRHSSVDRLLRSGEIGGGKGFTDKSSGSKENLLVKCFFNGVSCF